MSYSVHTLTNGTDTVSFTTRRDDKVWVSGKGCMTLAAARKVYRTLLNAGWTVGTLEARQELTPQQRRDARRAKLQRTADPRSI